MRRNLIDLRNEPEIYERDRAKPQILDSDNPVENMFQAVGAASRCWKDKNGEGVFDEQEAIRVANELCAYIRILTSKQDNLEYLEWKYEKKNREIQNAKAQKV